MPVLAVKGVNMGLRRAAAVLRDPTSDEENVDR
jgi:hypothetical protein